MIRNLLVSAAAVALMAGCSSMQTTAPTPPIAEAPMVQLVQDIHSFARPNEARVTDVAVDLDADFERRILSGTATLSIQTAPGAGELVLDTRDLTIRDVTIDGQSTGWRLGVAREFMGRPLIINIGPGTDRISLYIA